MDTIKGMTEQLARWQRQRIEEQSRIRRETCVLEESCAPASASIAMDMNRDSR
jgi:hypothetical protein